MATGPGELDSEGIWLFGEADDETLMSDTLNLGQSATSAAFTLDRGRLDDVEDRLDDLEEDTGWVPLTLTNSWSAYSSETPKVRRLGGIVYFQGSITGGSSASAFTLPAGFRPENEIFAPCFSGSSATVITRVVVQPGGTTIATSGGQARLTGIRPFPAYS